MVWITSNLLQISLASFPCKSDMPDAPVLCHIRRDLEMSSVFLLDFQNFDDKLKIMNNPVYYYLLIFACLFFNTNDVINL